MTPLVFDVSEGKNRDTSLRHKLSMCRGGMAQFFDYGTHVHRVIFMAQLAAPTARCQNKMDSTEMICLHVQQANCLRFPRVCDPECYIIVMILVCAQRFGE